MTAQSRIDETRLRPAGRATREAIESAARRLFIEHGYDETSVRAIASAAGIDPALVIRHFGSKEELFLHVVVTVPDQLYVLDGPTETLGRQMMTMLLSDEAADFRATFTRLLEAAHHPNVRDALIRTSTATFIEPLATRLEGEHTALRMMMVGSQITGLLTSLFLWRGMELTPDQRDYVVATYGDAMQRVLTP